MSLHTTHNRFARKCRHSRMSLDDGLEVLSRCLVANDREQGTTTIKQYGPECLISNGRQNDVSTSALDLNGPLPLQGLNVSDSSYVPSIGKSKATQSDTIYVTESLPLSFSLPTCDWVIPDWTGNFGTMTIDPASASDILPYLPGPGSGNEDAYHSQTHDVYSSPQIDVAQRLNARLDTSTEYYRCRYGRNLFPPQYQRQLPFSNHNSSSFAPYCVLGPATRPRTLEESQMTADPGHDRREYVKSSSQGIVNTRRSDSSQTPILAHQAMLSGPRDSRKRRRASESNAGITEETERPHKRTKMAVHQELLQSKPPTYGSTTVCGDAKAILGDVNHHTHHHYHGLRTWSEYQKSREKQKQAFVSSIVAAATKHGIDMPGVPPVKDPDAVSRWVREVIQANMCATTIWDGETAIVPSTCGSSLQHIELAAIYEDSNEHDSTERQRSTGLQDFATSIV